MSMTAIHPRRFNMSTEEEIESYKASRINKGKCQACGEPVLHYGYCLSCEVEIQKRIDKLKKIIVNNQAALYKDEYIVTDITNI